MQRFKGKITILNPIIRDMNPDEEEKISVNKLIPKYALTSSLSNNAIIKLISNILDSTNIEENLPLYLIKKFKF